MDGPSHLLEQLEGSQLLVLLPASDNFISKVSKIFPQLCRSEKVWSGVHVLEFNKTIMLRAPVRGAKVDGGGIFV